MNELSTILVSVISTLVPLIGGGAFLFRKQQKRIKEAEARLAEVSVDKAKVETRTDEWHLWKEQLNDTHKVIETLSAQLLEMTKDNDRKEDIISDKTRRIREKEEQNLELYTSLLHREQRIASMQRFIDWLKNWHCAREWGRGKEDCMRRKPEQKVKMTYDPPIEMGEEDAPDDMIEEKVEISATAEVATGISTEINATTKAKED